MSARDPATGTLRLLVRLPGDDDARALRTGVPQVLGPVDELGDAWEVAPLFPDAQTSELAECWVVSGAIASVPAYDSSRVAYDAARLLSEHLGAQVEPDLPSTSYGLEPPPSEDDQEAIGDTRGTHLPGSASTTWALDSVRAREAWRLEPAEGGRAKGAGVLVGSIDTGYTDHPELDGALSLQLDRDVLSGDDDARDPLERRPFSPLDSPGHGTHTASVVASREHRVITGAAPLATIVPIRAVRSVVQVLDGDVARAVHEAHRRGCQVITMSLGGRGFFGLRDAIRAAVRDGVIVMAAAGNKVGVVVAPAVYPECLAVAATNVDSKPWSGSSRGHMVDISAPGESVWVASVDSTRRPPRFLERRHDGTSFAVATLAGVAALWVAHHGHDRIVARYGRSRVQWAFLSLLRTHGHRVPPGWDENGWDRLFGVGIVDAEALLRAGLPEIDAVEVPERVLDAVARLQAVLAGLDRDQVRSALAGLLGVEPAEVDDLPEPAVSELVYRIGEDDDLRESLVAAATDISEGPAREAATARLLLRRTSSAALAGRPAFVAVRPTP